MCHSVEQESNEQDGTGAARRSRVRQPARKVSCIIVHILNRCSPSLAVAEPCELSACCPHVSYCAWRSVMRFSDTTPLTLPDNRRARGGGREGGQACPEVHIMIVYESNLRTRQIPELPRVGSGTLRGACARHTGGRLRPAR